MNDEIKEKLLAHFGTKSKMARALGVSRQQVNHWYNDGKMPSMRCALKLAKAIGIDWMEIRVDLRDL